MSIDLLPFTVASFMVLFSLALGVFMFIKGPQNLAAKIPAMTLCSLVIVVSLSLSIYTGLVAIEWHRICRGGESYIKTVILMPENRKVINWSKEITQEEKYQ